MWAFNIYRILNLTNGRYYIGCTSYVDGRIYQHMTQLFNGKHIISDWQNDYNDNHKFEASFLETVSVRGYGEYHLKTWAEYKYIANELAYNSHRHGLSGLSFKEPIGNPLYCFTKSLWFRKGEGQRKSKKDNLLYLMRVE